MTQSGRQEIIRRLAEDYAERAAVLSMKFEDRSRWLWGWCMQTIKDKEEERHPPRPPMSPFSIDSYT